MSEQANIQLVEQAYAAFGRGDVQGVLTTLTEDIEWQIPGPSDIPYAGKRHGRDGAAEFFRLLSEASEILQFEPREFFTKGDKVLVLGYYRGRARATGKVVESEWAHVFSVRNGKIGSFREYYDTAAIAASYRQEAAAGR
jgi:ketosteroid isomerase-like protein